jgi:hypothetical protein
VDVNVEDVERFGRTFRVLIAGRRMTVSPSTVRFESHLEDAIQASPHLLGMRLLILWRQVTFGPTARIDLLAIDVTGTIHIIELKRDETSPRVIVQVLYYEGLVRNWTRSQFCERFARFRPGETLEGAFRDFFGVELPRDIGAARVITVVASSIDRKTTVMIKGMREHGYAVRVLEYSYLQQVGIVVTEPWNPAPRETPGVRSERAAASVGRPSWAPFVTREKAHVVRQGRGSRYWDEYLSPFWDTYAEQFDCEFLASAFLYSLYDSWRDQAGVAAAGAVDLPLLQFGWRMSKVMQGSGAWRPDRCIPALVLGPHQDLEDQAIAAGWKMPIHERPVNGYLRQALILM